MRLRLFVCFLLLLPALSLRGQDLLPAARIRARAGGKALPALGLPVRADGGYDQIVYTRDGRWFGADSLKAKPHWTMWMVFPQGEAGAGMPEAVQTVCRSWATEKPAGPVFVVAGPVQGARFVSLCTRAKGALGWKSIAFALPEDGPEAGKDIYTYSCSVNWVEFLTGYNLYPNLPSYLQETVEEMTASELLCPFQEFEPAMDDAPEREIDYDREEDYREM